MFFYLTYIFIRFAQKEGFFKNFGLLPEHFEYSDHSHELNFIKGNNGEYLMLALLFGGLTLIWAGRKHNEDGISAEIKTTNTYARIRLDDESSKPSKWEA